MKTTLLKIVLLSSLLLAMNATWSDETETLDELLARIDQVTAPYESEYADKLSQYGTNAVPRLIELLKHPDKDVAEIAALALRGCSYIDEKYLPQIIDGLDRDIGWLPNALGRIPTDAAAEEAVKRYLAADTSPWNQEANAVSRQGIRAVPFIIQAALSTEKDNEGVCHLLGYVLQDMNAEAKQEAAHLLQKTLNDETSSTALLHGILTMVYYLGEDEGRLLETDLIRLREAKPELKSTIDNDLVCMRSALSGQILAERLRKSPGRATLLDIAWIGKAAAKDTGPEVLRILENSTWETRRAAAHTLGAIEYKESTPALCTLLNEPHDVILNWIAANSLGKLHAKSATEALQKTAENHWHPAVRMEAKLALKNMYSSEPYDSDSHRLEIEEKDLPEAPTKQTNATPPEVLEKLAYEITIPSTVTPTITQIPDVALRVENGWLAGSSRGEWGGELRFIGDNGIRYEVSDEHTQNVFMLGEKVIAITGVAVWFSNDGMIYELSQQTDGKWQAVPWRALPGAPRESHKMPSGEIMIATDSGGNVILSEDGSFRMVQ
ncbi:MAG: hypothetical protein JXR25_15125 [Pontiellaceae bacterium]|nr:hypothetical protein [Pontiellaceae bacterium]MBN2786152.1 hypothetical protein [Pontiellaceae bacterium]